MKGGHREGGAKKFKGRIGETQLWVCEHLSTFGDVEAQPLEEKFGHFCKGERLIRELGCPGVRDTSLCAFTS